MEKKDRNHPPDHSNGNRKQEKSLQKGIDGNASLCKSLEWHADVGREKTSQECNGLADKDGCVNT